MNVLILSDDLIDSSKLIADARQRGKSAIQCRSCEMLKSLLSDSELEQVIIDLQHPLLQLEALMNEFSLLSGKPEVIAYGSHVDAERLKLARSLGCQQVFTRSQLLK
jgi:hypothetical protein